MWRRKFLYRRIVDTIRNSKLDIPIPRSGTKRKDLEEIAARICRDHGFTMVEQGFVRDRRPRTTERMRTFLSFRTLDEAVSQMGEKEVKNALRTLRRWHGKDAVKIVEGIMVFDESARWEILCA